MITSHQVNDTTRYVLSFPEVSSLLLSTKDRNQAETNFGLVPSGRLSEPKLHAIERLQRRLGVIGVRSIVRKILRRLAGRG